MAMAQHPNANDITGALNLGDPSGPVGSGPEVKSGCYGPTVEC